MDAPVASCGAACDFVLRGASELLSMRGVDLGVVEQGALAARGGRIVWVGEERDLERVVAV
ncbi:MAG TPA: hypothetical protein VJ787_08455, partial [Thermoleophilia bacterium]|nr:hypothetical protein [Thermoleophilia bacterium]